MHMDVALTTIGRKSYYVPFWLWCELQPDAYGQQGGGIRRLIEDYGLRRYWAHPSEAEAIDNIERHARALWLYFSRPSSRRQRRILTTIERQTLTLERVCTIKHPELKGVRRLDWIAEELDRVAGYPPRDPLRGNYGEYTPRRVQEILETAAEALLAAEQDAQTKALRKQIRDWTAAIAAVQAAGAGDDYELAAAA